MTIEEANEEDTLFGGVDRPHPPRGRGRREGRRPDPRAPHRSKHLLPLAQQVRRDGGQRRAAAEGA